MFKKGDIVHRVERVIESEWRKGVDFGGHYEVESVDDWGWMELKGTTGKWYHACFVISDRTAATRANQERLLQSALKEQMGGNHYKGMKIQPVEFIHANNIGYMEGNVIKYITRWQLKNGLEDLNKAKHYIELLIEMEKNATKTN